MKKAVLAFVVAVGALGQSAFALVASQGNAIANAALSRVGTPYVWGGKTTAGFDCSGLASWAYRSAGYSNIPLGTAQDQLMWCTSCTNQRGSLLFFDTNFDGLIDHVAIRDTPGFMIESAYGVGVRRQAISPWYQARLVTSASR